MLYAALGNQQTHKTADCACKHILIFVVSLLQLLILCVFCVVFAIALVLLSGPVLSMEVTCFLIPSFETPKPFTDSCSSRQNHAPYRHTDCLSAL